jgi:four helix bundle protein
MATIKRFEDLEVWQKAADFDERLSSLFSYERFRQDLGLRTQALNSSGSCQDNIAEGFERGGNKEFMHFLRISKGSIGETRGQVRRAIRRGLISETEGEALISDCLSISKQLGAFINYLKQSELKGERYTKEPEAEYLNDDSMKESGILNLESTDQEFETLNLESHNLE